MGNPRRRSPAAVLGLCAFLLGLPRPALSWGFHGHRLVNRKAVGTLPDSLRKFFAANAEYVSEHSVDSDLERTSSSDPNHFLDMDAFGKYPFPDIPLVEAEHLARFGPEAAEKGRVPWRVGEIYAQLVEALRAGESALALKRAADLGHFVADAHVPLHATLNHDGQLTGQRGLHNRWESTLVERLARQLEGDVQPAAARRVGEPAALTLAVLRESWAHHLEVLASDREAVDPSTRDLAETPEDDRYDDEYYSRLSELEGARVRARLSAAASLLGSLWLSAWEDAGRPSLPGSFRIPYVRGKSRAILVSLDCGAAHVFDEAVARGVMPHLAALRRRGAVAEGSITTLPVKTAPGHATLYTGAWPDRHGIAGNEYAPPGAAVTETMNGYSSTGLRAEPLWFAAARQDLEATVVSATQAYPFTAYTDGRFAGWAGSRLTLLDQYQNVEAGDAVYTAKDVVLRPPAQWLGDIPRHTGEPRELRLEVAGVGIDGLLFDDPADPAPGFDTLYLTFDRSPSGGITLKPEGLREDAAAFAGLLAPMPGGEAVLYFRLFSLAPDGSELLLYRAAPHVPRSNKRLEAALLEATGGVMGNAAGPTYERGDLGPPLWKGGDGTAERRYLETIALMVRQFSRLVDFGVDRTAWKVLFTYIPLPDEAAHPWWGFLDPTLPGHDPALAARIRPHFDRMLRYADDYVGHLAARAGTDTILAVAADHGTTGADRMLKPNVVLAAAGLLALDAQGKPDLDRTRAYYHPGTFILINRTSRQGGIVPPEGEEAVRREAVAALRAVRDPRTKGPVVLEMIDSRTPGREPAVGGPAGGDLYFSLAPGYALGRGTSGAAVEPVTPRGEHVTNPERPRVWASFALAGPGVAAGAKLGVIRQIDIAPTLAALLGIDPPAHSVGHALEAALAERVVYPKERPPLSGWPAPSRGTE